MLKFACSALLLCVIGGCDDDPLKSVLDVAGVSDTVPVLETTIGEPDATLPDTTLDTRPADTQVVPDSEPLEDTLVADTQVIADSETLQDTQADSALPDTQTPQDTTPQDATPQETQVVDTTPQDTTQDAQPEVDTGPGPDPVDNGLNASWIGGACDTPADCDHPSFNEAELCQTSEFPNGFCTQACRQSTSSGAWICPDADTSAGTDFTTTRCISANGTPGCVAECDFSKSDSGCRPGYSCALRSRHGQPDSVFPVCLPEPLQRWPGEPALADDIGNACNKPSDCANRSCLGLPGGYCSKAYCDTADCPGASTCFGFSAGESACLSDCGVDSECRTSEGYECDSDGTCWPGNNAPTWNPNVSANDCMTACGNAGSGLSVCDATKDDYVVLHKSARNLALCNKGNLVANYQMGLGFAPIGDKQEEGDGRTPEGVFYVPQLVPDSDYHLAFLVSYPDKVDAARGLTGGLVTQAQKNAIDTAQTQCGTPPQSTGLGGWIEIHGEGGESDWTLGCAALDNDAIDVLWATIGVRDTIVILP